MKIFLPEVDISEDEGFSKEKDIFGREEFGRGLIHLLGEAEDPLVILLDAPWGTGKTTFLKMFAGELRQQGHPVIFFDAFASDYMHDAFLAISGEVIALSSDLKSKSAPAHQKFLKKASAAGRVLLSSAAKIGVKAATLGVIEAADIGVISEVRGDIASESGKPTFALEILEAIKHLFSTDGIHFVVSAHLPQLEASVRYSYGNDTKAKEYLQKFYSMVVTFTPSDLGRGDRHIVKFVEHCKGTLFVHDNHKDEKGYCFDIVADVAEARNLSLREVGKILAVLNLCLAFTPPNYLRLGPIVAVLCVLKVVDPEMFARAKRGALTFQDVENSVRFDNWPSRASSSQEFVRSWWLYVLEPDLEKHKEQDWKRFSEALWRYNISDDRKRLMIMMANKVVDRLMPVTAS